MTSVAYDNGAVELYVSADLVASGKYESTLLQHLQNVTTVSSSFFGGCISTPYGRWYDYPCKCSAVSILEGGSAGKANMVCEVSTNTPYSSNGINPYYDTKICTAQYSFSVN
jgi:hypothetical protein